MTRTRPADSLELLHYLGRLYHTEETDQLLTWGEGRLAEHAFRTQLRPQGEAWNRADVLTLLRGARTAAFLDLVHLEQAAQVEGISWSGDGLTYQGTRSARLEWRLAVCRTLARALSTWWREHGISLEEVPAELADAVERHGGSPA